jgi:Ca2+-binding RTX toxin-like protein
VRTTALTTAGLLALAVLGPAPITHAAGETCRGEAATIVGTPANPALLGSDGVVGTEGRDVVVTNGAWKVSTLGGDDVVCVTAGGTSNLKQVVVDAGAGDDVVDGTTAPDWIAQVDLGAGVDRFEGGAAGSVVRGAHAVAAPADTEKDVFVGGAGPDLVESGVVGQPNPDVIALGDANDSVVYRGLTAPGGSIDGGAGTDQLYPSPLATPGDVVVDNTAGRFLVDQQVMMSWSGMESFWTGTTDGHELAFVGTEADETLNVNVSGRVRATFGAGDDSFRANQAPRAGSAVDGGDGRDHVYVTSESGLLDLDLGKGTLVADAGSPYATAALDFEDASLFARRVVLDGTGKGNDLRFSACEARVRGRDGADTIARTYDSLFETVFCPRFARARLDGGGGRDDLEGTVGRDVLVGGGGRDELSGANGNDVLRGGGGNDRLLGGQGRDRADGGPGRKDVCRAEQERRCEG